VIEVRDTTVKQIARPDSAVTEAFAAASAAAAEADGLNPGEAFSVAVSELFEGLACGQHRPLPRLLDRPVGAGG